MHESVQHKENNNRHGLQRMITFTILRPRLFWSSQVNSHTGVVPLR